MASLNKIIDRKTSGITREIVELLHDTPLPSLDDIRDDISTIKSFVKDIKAEVKHIESMIPNQPDSPNQQQDDQDGRGTESQPQTATRELRDKLADMLEDKWGKYLLPGLEEWHIMGQLIDKLRSDEPLNLLDILGVISAIFFDIMTPLQLPPLQLPDLHQAGIQFVSDRTKAMLHDANEALEEIIDLNTALLSNTLNVMSDDIAQMLNQIGDLRSALDGYHDANTTYLASIYDKILECCVVDDMQVALRLLGEQSDLLRSIKAILAVGGSPAQLGQLGAITAGIKSIQAELLELRRLL